MGEENEGEVRVGRGGIDKQTGMTVKYMLLG